MVVCFLAVGCSSESSQGRDDDVAGDTAGDTDTQGDGVDDDIRDTTTEPGDAEPDGGSDVGLDGSDVGDALMDSGEEEPDTSDPDADPLPHCGDGVAEAGEGCDLGALNGLPRVPCTVTCDLTVDALCSDFGVALEADAVFAALPRGAWRSAEVLTAQTPSSATTWQAPCGGRNEGRLVIAWTASRDGYLEARVDPRWSSPDVSLSLRDGCGEASATLACSTGARSAVAPVRRGTTTFFVVDGPRGAPVRLEAREVDALSGADEGCGGLIGCRAGLRCLGDAGEARCTDLSDVLILQEAVAYLHGDGVVVTALVSNALGQEVTASLEPAVFGEVSATFSALLPLREWHDDGATRHQWIIPARSLAAANLQAAAVTSLRLLVTGSLAGSSAADVQLSAAGVPVLLLPINDPCDAATQSNGCEEGAVCREAGAQTLCVAGQAPTWTSATLYRTTRDTLQVLAEAEDPDGDLLEVEVRALDEAGAEIAAGVFPLVDVRSSGDGSYAFALALQESAATPLPTTTQRVALTLIDRAGLRSAELFTGAPTALPPLPSRAECPARGLDPCGEGTLCSPFGADRWRCEALTSPRLHRLQARTDALGALGLEVSGETPHANIAALLVTFLDNEGRGTGATLALPADRFLPALQERTRFVGSIGDIVVPDDAVAVSARLIDNLGQRSALARVLVPPRDGVGQPCASELVGVRCGEDLVCTLDRECVAPRQPVLHQATMVAFGPDELVLNLDVEDLDGDVQTVWIWALAEGGLLDLDPIVLPLPGSAREATRWSGSIAGSIWQTSAVPAITALLIAVHDSTGRPSLPALVDLR